jgi:glycosyltransferase involved in cell wall biosynthesis
MTDRMEPDDARGHSAARGDEFPAHDVERMASAGPAGTEALSPTERAQPRLAIVVPCYNEAPVVRETAGRITGVLRDLITAGAIRPESFIYFVDDGSIDGTWNIVCELHKADPLIKALKLARNFGHQNALLAGLMSVKDRADCVITMDADLQHDESAIYGFLERYKQGADIVYGVRSNPGNDSYIKRGGSSLFYWLMRSMGVRIIKDHPDYRLVAAPVLNALAAYREVNLFLRGIFADIGFRSELMPFDTRERFAGTSHYSLGKMLAFALDGITSFSVLPLRLIGIAGAAIMLAALSIGGFVIVSAIRGNVVPGWASTVLPIYVLGGLQILIIGILAEYIGKIYSEVKQRPRFIKERELT